ncbi:MAG TPA: DUF4129 domain-containing protein [Acidobacteriota bacterium]|nr:DUF4129 domain-containing protein [Acidobacteriota bacterium]
MQPNAPNPPAAADIERSVDEILRRPEFQGNALANWFSELLQWVFDSMASLSGWANANPTGKWILTAVLLLILAGLLAHIGWTIWQILPKRGGTSLRRAGQPWKTLEGRVASWPEALQLARRALSRGDFYSAVWISHRMLLGVLDDKGALEFAGWKTNRDYLRECRGHEEGYKLLDRLSQAFDQTVYAHRPAPRGELEGLLNQVDEFYRQAER